MLKLKRFTHFESFSTIKIRLPYQQQNTLSKNNLVKNKNYLKLTMVKMFKLTSNPNKIIKIKVWNAVQKSPYF